MQNCWDFGGQVISFIGGIVASFFSWWVLFHWYSPKVTFSDYINKSRVRQKRPYPYSFEIKNEGRRNIIDLHLYAKLRFKWRQDGRWTVMYVPLDAQGDRFITVSKLSKGKARTLSLHIDAAQELRTSPRFTNTFHGRAKQGKLTLEEILGTKTASQAQLKIDILGYDEFSGARKIFEKTYDLGSIQLGKYND